MNRIAENRTADTAPPASGERYNFDLFRESSWVASCVVENASVCKCYAVQLGLSGPETDEILSAIVAAIANGQSHLDWREQRFEWKFSRPSAGYAPWQELP